MSKKKCVRIPLSVLLAACVVVAVLAGLLSFPQAAPDQTTVIIPGTYTLNGGSRSGFNYYHMEGYGAIRPGDAPTAAFWQDTFCTHKDYNAAPGSYVYYYNANPDETAAGNPLFYTNILNQGTDIKNGLEMTVEQWRDLRYCILYTNVNRDSFGQYAYWTYLATKIPERYSGMGGRATWSDAWMTQYFGAKASGNFMGLGPIADGQTIDLGAQINVQFTYNGSTTIPSSFALDTANPRVGPFKIEWTSGSDPVLAQLNCGPNKDTPPLFNLSATGSAVRFYSSAGSRVPITSIRLGDEFYVEYNANAPIGGTLNVSATAQNALITKVLADQFFIHPNAQNQTNVDTDTSKPAFDFTVTVPEKTPPTVPDNDYTYVRPTVDKLVAEDTLIDPSGNYQDVLPVPPGTDVIHQMTVTSTDPKGTILTFQNTDYDLYPSALNFPTLYNAGGGVYGAADASAGNPIYDSADPAHRNQLTLPANTALVYTAAQFRAAIDANSNIKLMSNITIPSTWTASATIYSGIFDGNGFVLQGDGGTMIEPVFRRTDGAVFYRVSFTGFTMARSGVIGGANGPTDGSLITNRYFIGSLVDYMESTNGNAAMIDCYVQGTLTVSGVPSTDSGGNYGADPQFMVGGAVGEIGDTNYAREVYGVKAKMTLSISGGTNPSYSGGIFGYARTAIFENCELMAGSEITDSFPWFGGIASAIYMTYSGGTNTISNCKADYTFTTTTGTTSYYPGNYTRRFGGLMERCSNVVKVDRCEITCDYHDNSNTNALTNFGGIVTNRTASGSNTNMAFTNCSVVFTGDPVTASQSAAGIFTFNDCAADKATVDNCFVNVNIVTGQFGGGIFTNSTSGNPGVQSVTVTNCQSSGSITARAAGTNIAGIGVDNSKLADKVTIANCVSDMALSDNGLGSVQIGGILRTVLPGGPIAVSNCLFAGETAPLSGGSGKNEIFNCSTAGVCAGVSNYTINAGTGLTDPDGEHVDQSTFYASADALSFFQTTLGWGGNIVTTAPDPQTGSATPAFYLENIGTAVNPYYLPAVATAYRWPPQRVYVTDDYNQNNSQESISNLYIWNGTAFVSLWDAGTRMSGTDASDPNAAVDFRMTGSTFTFYYFVGSDSTESKSSGQDGPWQNTGVWQNTVNITPRDNVLSFPDDADNPGSKDYTKPTFDWSGAMDDDWVLDQDFPITRFNLIKMTTVSNYPMPLDGCEFQLYRSDSVYSDFTGADLNDGTWTLAATLSPSDYIGLDAADRPVVMTGSYVLVETNAPANYSGNIGATWYLVFSGGVLRMYSDAALSNEIPLGNEQGVLPDYPNTLIYSAHVENGQNPDTPLARISIAKEDDAGNSIVGQTVMANGMPQFTGAVYALRKYQGANWTGATFGYGNMLVYGTDADGVTMLQNWCDIEPGYYELVEIRAPVGYVTDPTPVYIDFDPNASPQLTINAGTHNAVSSGLDATVDIGALNGGPAAAIHVKDVKPVYQITLRKYNAQTDAAIDGIDFQLISTADNSVVSTVTTAGTNGETTVTIPSQPDGIYILREVLKSTQQYAPAPDYTVEVRNGELYIKGGPDDYNFKIVNGQRDNQYYVIQDPDGAAVPLDSGSLPPDVTIDNSDALTIGLIHATLGVPNTPVNGAFWFTKTDPSGNPLTGVQFSLYTGTDTTSLYATASSDADGVVLFTGLTAGDYTLVETAALPGYQLPAGSWLISVADGTGGITITAQGNSLPPAFKVATDGSGNKNYSLSNYHKTILPRTGVSTAVLFTVSGTVLVGLAAGLAITFRRRKRSVNRKASAFYG